MNSAFQPTDADVHAAVLALLDEVVEKLASGTVKTDDGRDFVTALADRMVSEPRRALENLALFDHSGNDNPVRAKWRALIRRALALVQTKTGKSLFELELGKLDGKHKIGGEPFCSDWPYNLKRLDDGSYVVLNRHYAPLDKGHDYLTVWRYEEHKHCAVRFPCDPADLKGIWFRPRSLYLYNDSYKSREGYFGRLGKLIAATSDPLKYFPILVRKLP